jgi:hypothetical protein
LGVGLGEGQSRMLDVRKMPRGKESSLNLGGEVALDVDLALVHLYLPVSLALRRSYKGASLY